jgi:hypothetical protein
MENQQLVSPSRQCSSTPVGSVKDFLTKNNVTTLEHSSYSSHLAPADFYLFPGLKSSLKGRRFCYATDIIKNATKELKRLLQNGLQEYFLHLYSRWEKCIVAILNAMQLK